MVWWSLDPLKIVKQAVNSKTTTNVQLLAINRICQIKVSTRHCQIASHYNKSNISAFYNKSILSSASISRTDSELENKVCISPLRIMTPFVNLSIIEGQENFWENLWKSAHNCQRAKFGILPYCGARQKGNYSLFLDPWSLMSCQICLGSSPNCWVPRWGQAAQSAVAGGLLWCWIWIGVSRIEPCYKSISILFSQDRQVNGGGCPSSE